MSKDKKRALAILFAFGFLTELLVAQTNLWTYSSQLVRVGCVIGLYLFVIGGIVGRVMAQMGYGQHPKQHATSSSTGS